jgi:8-oxo-dGTP pyrophosphatase MutT (NUDIX family)
LKRALFDTVDNASLPEISPQAQVGALCWRRHGGGVQVLLITSRETGRWVIPKGGLIAGKTEAESAMAEAWEEAGVVGHPSAEAALGCFDYQKINRKIQISRRCDVTVFALKVDRLIRDYPERGQRKRKWFTAEKASVHVMEAGLRALFQAIVIDATPLTAKTAP